MNIDIDRANDQLVLRGGPEVMAKAKDALEHLFSGEATVEVTPRLIATIIGKQGSTIERLQEESGASINVSRADNNVVIRGTPEVCLLNISVYIQSMFSVKVFAKLTFVVIRGTPEDGGQGAGGDPVAS